MRSVRSVALVALLAAPHALLSPARADDLTILQWYEQPWLSMERRVPDLFLAGYDAVWLPPVSKAASTGSVGYDVFDRFDLGSPGSPTAYGTEQTFAAARQELQRANALVFIDAVLNHNSGRTNNLAFQLAGGWPGFWMGPIDPDKGQGDDWGDFHDGFGGELDGDLSGLIDIDQAANHRFIRHPVDPSDPRNIPPGTHRNLPDPANVRFYPDADLPAVTVHSPGAVNPVTGWVRTGPITLEFHPFDASDPASGDPVPDNATGLLMRWVQWMLEVQGVDGFRLDAAKHVPAWFWDSFFDTVVHQRWKTPAGTPATPLSFGEIVDGNDKILGQYFRKDGFGNRDALDVSGAGGLRDIRANPVGTGWNDVLARHLDAFDDGYQNGSAGINHVFSHDNGSWGNGQEPQLPTVREQGLFTHAYLLMRPGHAIVYHNARGVRRDAGAFWAREGVPLALGWNPAAGAEDPRITDLVRLRNEYGRGEFYVLNPSDLGTVIIFERRTPGGGPGNVLVAASDSYASGSATRTVTTGFPAGTRLHEQTGAAADPGVNPSGAIAPVLTVGPGGAVTLTVPNNVSSAGEHNHGYVVYGPALPDATLELTDVSSVLPADPAHWAPHLRRRADVPVIRSDAFTLRVRTRQADPLDPNTDDGALFRFNRGYADANGDGSVDFGEDQGVASGFERFLTTNAPLYANPGASEGLYEQTVDASVLPEGMNYITVRVFRHRDAGDPLFRELRQVVYIDRLPPALDFLDLPAEVEGDSVQVNVRTADRTAPAVYVLVNPPAELEPLLTPANLATYIDRHDHRKTVFGLHHGTNEIVAVAMEPTGAIGVVRGEVFAALCKADWDRTGSVTVNDLLAFLGAFRNGDADYDESGSTTINDLLAFLGAFRTGC